MALFEQHVEQAKKNLNFLKDISDQSKHFDWQVTACYYIAVHLINAHLAKCNNHHYKSHEATKQAINPFNQFTACKVDELVFNTYVALEKLSRRSRYLCNDSKDQDDNVAYLTYEKHVCRAIQRLNLVMNDFSKNHKVNFDKVEIICPKVKPSLSKTLEYFS